MKEKVVYKSDFFVDFEGKEHKLIMAAVSRPIKECFVIEGENTGKPIKKVLSIGVAVCCPDDKYDENIGMKIAYSKAVNKDCLIKLYVLSPGMINTQMVNSLMDQELAYIKNNPQTCIKGYKESYYKYIRQKESKKIFNSLTDEQKGIIEKYNNLSNTIREKLKKFFK